MRLLHLTGSAVDPLLDDVSRLYARGCLDAVGTLEGLEHVVAHVSPGGAWRFPAALDDASLAQAPALDLGQAVDRLATLGIDAALPQMFCRPGMTTYRGLLELLDIPYVGNRPDTMALGADKPRASAVVKAAGVAVPDSQVVLAGASVETLAIDLPVVVKPADSDNSLGVRLVRAAAEWDDAVREAAQHATGGRVLVESYVELGHEVRCGVVQHGDTLRCLPLEEYAVDAEHKPVRDHDDKLRRDDAGDLGLVAKDADHAWVLDPDDPATAGMTRAVQDAALLAYDALGCRHHGLFDFRVDPGGTPYFLEASLYCSFAPSSVVVTMARAAGLALPDLLTSSLALVATPPGTPGPDQHLAPATPPRKDPTR
ncbi:ATP-grasp domain-containing protein [Nocardioides KLBMP 9356]|uniref:ATP-grasp domain-containing protein n=1 Tax=Nocardioides potassii TaxID=2911371 RepID=A0ABS9HDJ1_9ACTN|nr:ATP-grasp domain-containing protein [Nocardioides potassii]MCF6378186.1 ATP-grasp domain-containing protein [Nocardioides potassii]